MRAALQDRAGLSLFQRAVVGTGACFSYLQGATAGPLAHPSAMWQRQRRHRRQRHRQPTTAWTTAATPCAAAGAAAAGAAAAAAAAWRRRPGRVAGDRHVCQLQPGGQLDAQRLAVLRVVLPTRAGLLLDVVRVGGRIPGAPRRRRRLLRRLADVGARQVVRRAQVRGRVGARSHSTCGTEQAVSRPIALYLYPARVRARVALGIATKHREHYRRRGAQRTASECTAVLAKTSHANCRTTLTNRPSRGRRGRFVRVVQQSACEVFERTAVPSHRDGQDKCSGEVESVESSQCECVSPLATLPSTAESPW